MKEAADNLISVSHGPDSRAEVGVLQARIAQLEAELVARGRDEIRVRHAAKLASLGQLTAGVAHELNTPLQFVTDNLHFLRDGVHGVLAFVETLRRVRDAARSGTVHPDFVRDADAAEALCDFDYLLSRFERSFKRTFDGLGRITTIVDAMKRFAHPRNELAPVDLDGILATTLAVATNEYKYVADVVTDFGDTPPIQGHASDLSQVFLNLIVNAAHAIADKGGATRGRIVVATRRDGDEVVVEVSDDGCGIAPELTERIFEPFFTTKEPGRGTGQGLTMAHAVIVDGHRGAIEVSSIVGQGTRMRVRLPIEAGGGGS